jgi:hypothetical protein
VRKNEEFGIIAVYAVGKKGKHVRGYFRDNILELLHGVR